MVCPMDVWAIICNIIVIRHQIIILRQSSTAATTTTTSMFYLWTFSTGIFCSGIFIFFCIFVFIHRPSSTMMISYFSFFYYYFSFILFHDIVEWWFGIELTWLDYVNVCSFFFLLFNLWNVQWMTLGAVCWKKISFNNTLWNLLVVDVHWIAIKGSLLFWIRRKLL